MLAIRQTISALKLPNVKRLKTSLELPAMQQVVGRSAVNTIRNHLFALDANRANELGGRRTHFYARAARSTSFKPIDNGVVVTISQRGMAQRRFGGKIKAVKSKYLTIPAHPDAHGRSAREFNNLEVIFGKRGAVGLMQRRASTLKNRRRKGARKKPIKGKVLYWLVKETKRQKADPTVLPTRREIRNDVVKALSNAEGAIRGTT